MGHGVQENLTRDDAPRLTTYLPGLRKIGAKELPQIDDTTTTCKPIKVGQARERRIGFGISTYPKQSVLENPPPKSQPTRDQMPRVHHTGYQLETA